MRIPTRPTGYLAQTGFLPLRIGVRCLLKLDWAESYDLIKFLHQYKFADEDTMTRLLKAPKVRKHLEKRLQALARMFPALMKRED